jgi:hypothetical protein
MITNKEKGYITDKGRSKKEREALKRRCECGCDECVQSLDCILSLDIQRRNPTMLEKNYVFKKHKNEIPFFIFNPAFNQKYMRDFNRAINESKFPKIKQSSWVDFLNSWSSPIMLVGKENMEKIVGANCLGFFFHQ